MEKSSCICIRAFSGGELFVVTLRQDPWPCWSLSFGFPWCKPPDKTQRWTQIASPPVPSELLPRPLCAHSGVAISWGRAFPCLFFNQMQGWNGPHGIFPVIYTCVCAHTTFRDGSLAVQKYRQACSLSKWSLSPGKQPWLSSLRTSWGTVSAKGKQHRMYPLPTAAQRPPPSASVLVPTKKMQPDGPQDLANQNRWAWDLGEWKYHQHGGSFWGTLQCEPRVLQVAMRWTLRGALAPRFPTTAGMLARGHSAAATLSLASCHRSWHWMSALPLSLNTGRKS